MPVSLPECTTTSSRASPRSRSCASSRAPPCVAFADSRLTLPQIAAELGATHLVEGSVRRADNRVRVVVQLIEARSDRNLWSETYDRELQDVFAIQSEIARKIASQLVERLSPAEVAGLERAPPTSNIAAYDAYNRARELWRQRGEDAAVVVPEIIMELREALRLDPSFAEAGSLLESIYLEWAENETDASPMQKGAARLAVKQLKRFGPALGRVLQSHLPEIETVADLVSAAATQRAAGRFDEATASLERAVAQEPRNRSLRMDLVSHLRTIGARAQGCGPA
jgi:tetratricopeptide (TPR) repeat protein